MRTQYHPGMAGIVLIHMVSEYISVSLLLPGVPMRSQPQCDSTNCVDSVETIHTQGNM
jgi:hypothetical protein